MWWLCAALVMGCGQKAGEQPAPGSVGGEQTGAPAKGATPAKGTPSTKSTAPGDADAARALFDEAIKARLMGDEVAHQAKMIELAAQHPNTRHGRRAVDRLGGGVAPVAVMGILAAVAIPAFLKYQSRAAEAQARVRMLQERQLEEQRRLMEQRRPQPVAVPANP